MSTLDALRAQTDRPMLTGTPVGLWLSVLAVEGYLVVAYFAFSAAEPTGELRYLVYPFVWLNVGAWAVWRTTPTTGIRRHRLVAVSVGAAYLLVLLWIPGSIGVGTAPGIGARVAWLSPGWGPLFALNSPWLRLYLIPFEILGYAALSYLVYANVLAVTRRMFSGLLGVATCVGCTVPVLAPLVGALGGPATGLATTTYQWSYDVGTLVFVLTVMLLVRGHNRTRNAS